MKLGGWGRYPLIETKLKSPSSIEELIKEISEKNLIARGNGRSYGDSAINKSNTISMKKFNRVIEFDDDSGLIVTESGILLSEIINSFLPKGWFPMVTPGSKFVTVGGMVACDVHGKNHHKEGSIANFTKEFELVLTDGTKVRCSRTEETELFWATLGGMGLTGTIYSATLSLKKITSSYIKTRTLKIKNLDSLCDYFTMAQYEQTYSVAWIDTLSNELGKSLLMLGEHADHTKIKNSKLSAIRISCKISSIQ